MDARELEQIFGEHATVHMPDEAEPPILAGATRDATYQWLNELQCQDDLKEVGIKPRRSALLSGPPGCGKTTLAHHLSARLGLPLILVNMQTVISMWCGGSANNIDRMFKKAEKHKDRTLLFFDEFDAVANRRIDAMTSAGQENNRITIAVLSGIDKFTGLFIAATNCADHIDAAIWRRFGMQLDVNLPDDDSRFAILKRYLHPMELPDDALDLLNELTNGATPDVLQKLMEGVKRDLVLSRRFDRPTDVVSTFVRVVVGIKPSPEIGPLPPLWAKPKESLAQLASLPWPPKLPNRKKD